MNHEPEPGFVLAAVLRFSTLVVKSSSLSTTAFRRAPKPLISPMTNSVVMTIHSKEREPCRLSAFFLIKSSRVAKILRNQAHSGSFLSILFFYRLRHSIHGKKRAESSNSAQTAHFSRKTFAFWANFNQDCGISESQSTPQFLFSQGPEAARAATRRRSLPHPFPEFR